MVEPDYEGMIELRADIFFVLDQVLLLVLANELLQHHLHGVELTISETADQVDLAESTDGQALEDLIFLQSSLSDKLDAIERHFFGLESAFSDGNAIVE